MVYREWCNPEALIMNDSCVLTDLQSIIRKKSNCRITNKAIFETINFYVSSEICRRNCQTFLQTETNINPSGSWAGALSFVFLSIVVETQNSAQHLKKTLRMSMTIFKPETSSSQWHHKIGWVIQFSVQPIDRSLGPVMATAMR